MLKKGDRVEYIDGGHGTVIKADIGLLATVMKDFDPSEKRNEIIVQFDSKYDNPTHRDDRNFKKVEESCKFKVGDRVRYIGENQQQFGNNLATVTICYDGRMWVKFDNEHMHLGSLEFFESYISPHKQYAEPKPSLMVVLFSYDGNCKTTMWKYAFWIASEAWRFDKVSPIEYMGYPVTRLRNKALIDAANGGFQYVLFLDADMAPDAYMHEKDIDFDVKPFLSSSFEFMQKHKEPCVVAAPYCGGPPLQNVYVMDIHDDTYAGDPEGRGTSMSCVRREDAARRSGIEQVTALPTGVMLIDTRIVDIWKKLTNNTPMFRYRYTDDEQTTLASTEDTVFTRDLTDLGIPCFVNWDSWAVHWKELPVGKPSKNPIRDNVSKAQYNAWKFGGWEPKVEK